MRILPKQARSATRTRRCQRRSPMLAASVTAALLVLTATMLPAADEKAVLDGPLSPEKTLAAFRLEPGLRIEIVAAEPVIESPVAMAFDERGRLFVAENRGYPTGPGGGSHQQAASRCSKTRTATGGSTSGPTSSPV